MSAKNVLRQWLDFFNKKEVATYAGGGTISYDPTANKITSGGSLKHDFSNAEVTLGTVAGTLVPTGTIVRAGVKRMIGTRAKVGATSGWTVGAANDLGTIATLAASQSGSTLVVYLDGLKIGDTITGFTINAQVESGGGTVTIDAALRALTNVAADPTDAGIGTGMTQVSVTADTAVAQEKTGLTEVVTAGKTYYLLITATTAGSTDIQLLAASITLTET